jgi:hypothetical protein
MAHGGCRHAWRGAAVALALAGVGLSAMAAELSFDRSPPLYRPGERPVLRHVPDDTAPVLVQDWRGREARSLSQAANADRRTAVLPALPAGYYEVVAGAQRRAFAVLEPPTGSSRTFGVMTHFAQGWDPGLVPWIARAGIGTVRDEQYWQQIEPQPGEYADPERYARYMHALRQADIEPLLVLSFANSHYDDGQTPFTPAGRAAFAAYGAELVRRHRDQVTAVEVWNEINGTFCSGPCRQDRAGTYAALLADSYAALKAANPGLTVVGGAAVKVPLPWFDALIARGAAAHWDALAVHPYTDDPESAARDIDSLRRQLRAAGSEAPIWVTEFGTGAGSLSAADRVATAAYLVRMAVVLRGAGIERMYWYLLRDYETFHGMGLLRADADPLGRYAPTPAYPAYATLIRLLDGATEVYREPTDPRTFMYTFRHEGEPTYVMWAPDGPLAAMVDMPQGGALVDMVGGTRPLPAGTSALTLDAHPQYLQGRVTRLDAPRPDTLLADARADFDVEKPSTLWTYDAYLMPPPADPSHPCGAAVRGPPENNKQA